MKKAFLFVDCQNDFFGGALPVPGAENIRHVLAKLNKLAKEENIPILKTMDCHTIDDDEFKVFPKHCVEDTEGQASIIETSAKNAIIFNKKTYDIFDKNLGNSKFESWINDNKITEIWVSGVVGNICVEAAVLGLLKRGIRVYIFKNAITWMDMEKGIFCNDIDNREKSITRMKKAGALIAVVKL